MTTISQIQLTNGPAHEEHTNIREVNKMESRMKTTNIKARISKTLAGVALAGLMAIVTTGGTVAAAPPNPGPIQTTDQGISMSEALLLEQWSDVWVRSSATLSSSTVDRGISASEALQLEEFGVYMRIGNASGGAMAIPSTVGKAVAARGTSMSQALLLEEFGVFVRADNRVDEAVVTRGTSMSQALLLEEFGVFVRADNPFGNALSAPTRQTQVTYFPEDDFTYGWS